MKTVEFIKSDSCDWEDHYFPAVKFNKDHSGRYVPAEVAERLLAAAKKIEENWAASGWGYNPELRDKLKAAIKQAEEGT